MTEPVVDEEAVRHVADLANIELADDEIAAYREEFAEILGYFDRLDDVPDRAPSEGRSNVLRPDTVRDSLAQEEALRNADETEDGYFEGPSVS